MSIKVDEKGQYKQFRGFTIVSSVVDVDYCWENVYNFLTKHDGIAAYYSPLPYDSYHMTTTMLENETMVSGSMDCQMDRNLQWEDHVNSRLPYYSTIVAALETLDICPTFTVQNVDVSGVIFVMGSIDTESETKIRTFAHEFDLSHMLPFDWHVSLAYKYSTSEISPAHEAEIKSYVAGQLMGKSFVLNKASFCYFNDMTKFIPHDGCHNPFDVVSHILIPSSQVGILIGRGGATILGVHTESGAKVQISVSNEPDSNLRKVLFKGTRSAVERAQELVRQITAIEDA